MSECLEWLWSRDEKGYGRLKYQGKSQKAHRVAYCEAVGVSIESIGGLSVMHTCDNPGCVNPSHLKLGTHLQNMQDMDDKARRVIVRGEQQGQHKLTEGQIVCIKARYVPYDRDNGTSALAREFGVHHSTIHRVISGKSWAHIKSVDLDMEVNGRALLN